MIKSKRLAASSLMIVLLPTVAPADIEQQRPGAVAGQPPIEKNTQQGPDERILWRLFHAGKFNDLIRQIEHLKRLYPKWQVPSDLVKALQNGKASAARIPDRLNLRRQRTVRTTAKKRSACSGKPMNWQRAKAYADNHQSLKAFQLYENRLIQCPDRQDQLQTLKHAGDTLEYADYVRLLELAKPNWPLFYLDRLRHESLKTRYLNSEELDAQQQDSYVAELSPVLLLDKDDALAEIIGWRYFQLQNYPAAARWFQQASAWSGLNQNAVYGRLLSLEQSGQYDRILTIAGEMQEPGAQIRAVIGRSYKVKAWQALDKNDSVAAAENLKRAREMLADEADLKELEAWIAQKNRRYGDAAELFDELYRQSPERKYARAYVQNQAVADRSLLARRAQHAGGLLLDEYSGYQAQELYFRKQFQSAYKLSPSAYPDLQNIAASSADLGAYARFKSGEDGLGRLDMFRMPVAGFSHTVFGNHTFKLSVSRVELYSGSPQVCRSDLGSLTPEASAKSACAGNDDKLFVPTRRLDHSLEIDFSYRKDGWFSPFINLGSTPIGGVVAPAVTFDVGFVQQTGYGHWSLEAYSQPIRQSILSYTGVRDPYRGTLAASPNNAFPDREWGRVLSTGFKSSVFYRFNDAWNMSGTVDYAWVEGKNVADNSMVSVSTGFGRNFDFKGFDYFTVGPSFNYQHFDKNLIHFTLGHGGYFSPEHYFNIGAGVNFLTEEARAYVVKGRVTAGFQSISEDASPWFPLLDPGRGQYASAHNSGEALDIELKGVWLVTPTIQLGGGAAVRKTSGFEDYTGGLFIRYFFEPRKASFSTDIPGTLFSSMY